MFPLLIRAAIVYVLVILGVRLMGKRQIGELQPTELVITILLSDIATMPLQNVHTPLLQSVVVIIVLIFMELLFSVCSLKSRRFRTLLQGNSVLIIHNGKLLQNEIRNLRYSVDDIMEALRLKDVFDVSEVIYAYVETNGTLSVLTKPASKDKLPQLQCLLISDGVVVEKEFDLCGMTRPKLELLLKNRGLTAADVFLMTYANDDDLRIVPKEAA